MITDTQELLIENNLAALRGDRSVPDLARETGLTRAAIYQIEAGKNIPQTRTALLLVKALGSPLIITVGPAKK